MFSREPMKMSLEGFMTEDPKPESPEGDDAEFERVLRNLVNTPHKPHVEKKGREPKPAPEGKP